MSMNAISSAVVNCGIAAGIGYVAATLASVDPVTGAVFGATSLLVYSVTTPLFAKMFAGPQANGSSRFLGTVLTILTSIAITATVSTLLGYPMTFHTGMVMTAATVASVFIGALLLKCCCGIDLAKTSQPTQQNRWSSHYRKL